MTRGAATGRWRPVLTALMILASVLPAGAQAPDDSGHLDLDPPPGRYAAPVTIRLPGAEPFEYRFLDPDGRPHTDFFLRAEDGLILPAPDGSEIRYTLELREAGGSSVRATYFIDRLTPEPPRLVPDPGLYTSAVRLQPTGDEEVLFRFSSARGADVTPLPSMGVVMEGIPGTITDETVLVYAVDEAGNRSAVRRLNYRLDLRGTAAVRPEPLLAPTGGSYANPQALFLDSRGLEVETFVLIGPEGQSTDLEPDSLVVPAEPGQYQLQLRARLLDGEGRLDRNLEWEQGNAKVGDLPQSGSYTNELRLQPPGSGLTYSLGGRPRPWIEVIRLSPLPDTRTAYTFEFIARDGSSRTRLVYLLDGRRAPPPLVIVEDGGATLRILNVPDAELEWLTPEGYRPAPPRVARGSQEWLSTAEALDLRSRFPDGAWTELRIDLPPVPSATDDGVPELLAELGRLQFGESARSLTFRAAVTASGSSHDGQSPVLRVGPGPPRQWQLPWGYLTELQLVPEGSGSEPGELIRFEARNAPPPPPEIRISNNRLRISGEGQLFYRLDDGPDRRYERPVELAGVQGGLRDYDIVAYRVRDGEISAEARTRHRIDDRIPVIGGVPEEVLTNASPYVLQPVSPYDDVVIHYEVAEGTRRPPLPDQRSRSSRSGILLEGIDGDVTDLSVSIRARFDGGERWSPLLRTRVTIDRDPPTPPRVDAAALEQGVLAFAEHPEDGVVIRYRLVGYNEDERIYLAPIRIDRSRTVAVEAVAVDPAGNRAPLADAIAVEAPGQPLPAPEILINGRPVGGSSFAASSELSAGVRATRTGAEIRWRIVRSDDPGNTFESFREARALGPGVYRIEAFQELPDGRRSDLSRLDLVVESSRIASPPAPEVLFNADGRSGTLIWPGSAALEVFARVTPASTSSQGDSVEFPFELVDGALPWRVGADTETIRVSYFSVDVDGRRSETVITEIQLFATGMLPPPEGVEDGGLYRAPQTIRFPSGSGVRFTLGTVDDPPAAVSSLSRSAEGPILLEVPPGEEADFILRYRRYDGVRPLSPERQLQLRIDRRPPEAPALLDLEDGGYYAAGRTLRLEPGFAEDRVYVRVITGDTPPGDNADFVLYEPGRPPQLPAGPVARRYTVEAFSEDAAGNRSRDLARWTITIDPFTLHLDPGTGDDANDGSRDAPLATLDEAVARIAGGDQRGLFLTSGSYDLDARAWRRLQQQLAEQSEALIIQGGFRSGSWDRDSAPSVLSVSESGSIDVAAPLRLVGLRLAQPLRFEGAESGDTLELDQVVLDRRPEETALTLRQGRLRIRDSVIGGVIQLLADTHTVARGLAAETVYVAGGRFEATGGELQSLQLSDGAAANLRDLDMEAETGTASVSAVVDVERSSLLLTNTTVRARGSNAIALRTRDATVELQDTFLHADGQTTALAIRSRASTVSIGSSRVSAVAASAYAVSSRGGSLDVDGAVLEVRATGDAVAVVAAQTTLEARRSAIWVRDVSDGQASLSAFNIDSGGLTQSGIHDSLIYTSGGDASVAIQAARPEDLALTENLLVGWGTLLLGRSAPDSWGAGQRVTGLLELEGASDRNRGNQVRSTEPAEASVEMWMGAPDAIPDLLPHDAGAPERR